MNYVEQQARPTRYIVSVTIAVILQLAIILALISGLAPRLAQKLDIPIKARIISEPAKPPPALAPPPPPAMLPPPPPFVPPPKITVQHPLQTHAIKEISRMKPPSVQAPATNPVKSAPAVSSKDHTAGAVPINGARPIFPPEMEDENREGYVKISCDIGTNGRATNCTVLQQRGGQAFVEATYEFLRRARYQPAVENGVTVVERHHVFDINFRLNSDEDDD